MASPPPPLTSQIRRFVWAFCTSHYSGSKSVTRSYSEPSSRCGRSCCIPGTLNESFFSRMKNPSESLLENSVPSALHTFAALFIKSLKLYQFFTWKGYFSNFHLLNICCMLHRISWEFFYTYLWAWNSLLTRRSWFPLRTLPCKKNTRALGLRFCTTDLHCQD